MEIDVKRNRTLELEYSDFLQEMPLPKAIEIAEKFAVRTDEQDVELIVNRVKHCYKSGIGMSLLRMGDGEGRVLYADKYYNEITKCSKDIANNVWFKYSRCYPEADFFDRLKEAYVNSDFVGYVPRYRIELEYDNVWYGYYGCAQGNKFILDKVLNRDVAASHNRLIRNWAHVLLFKNTEFLEMLSDMKLCIVTCHNQREELCRYFSNDNIELILTPPENNPVLNDHSAKVMYPDVFDSVLGRIEDMQADMVLSSCGVFAKIFSDVARVSGKVGIDIGAVLDGILNHKTR